MTSPQRWTRAEREIAVLLGGVRLPNTGYGQPDVIAGHLAVQVKTRAALPAWCLDAADQSIRDAGPNQSPVVIVNLVTLGRRARRFLVADLDTVLIPEGDE